MSVVDPGAVSGPLTSAQVLDELEFLAAVEHALIVECLSVHCALGHDLAADEGGAATQPGSDAAAAAASLAQSQMFRFKNITSALLGAGRGSAQLGRADSISSPSVAPVPLGPPTAAQLGQLPDREEGIARAVDERYTLLAPAVTSAPVFAGQALDDLQSVIVTSGPTHAAAFASLREALGTLAPADVLRVTRRDPADAFEQRLLDISDQSYALTLSILGFQFTPDGGFFLGLAVSAMNGLDAINRVLAQRGLLPPFTLP
jgi:hypothetical protein